MIFSLVKRRGKPKRTLKETILGDLRLNNIPETLVFNRAEWHHVIHEALLLLLKYKSMC